MADLYVSLFEQPIGKSMLVRVPIERQAGQPDRAVAVAVQGKHLVGQAQIGQPEFSEQHAGPG